MRSTQSISLIIDCEWFKIHISIHRHRIIISWWEFQSVGQLADHISMWPLFIFRWACFELRTILPERQDNQVISQRGLTITRLIHSIRSYPCNHVIPRKDTYFRRCYPWENTNYLIFLSERSTKQKRLLHNKKGANIRDKHLRQFIIAWYGIAHSDGEVLIVFTKFQPKTLSWQQFRKLLPRQNFSAKAYSFSYSSSVFVYGFCVGVHLRKTCHHHVDALNNIAISIANKIMHYNKVETQVIKVTIIWLQPSCWIMTCRSC